MKERVNVEMINIFLRKNGFSINELCKRAHISRVAYDKMVKENKYKYTTVFKIANVMSVCLCELYNEKM